MAMTAQEMRQLDEINRTLGRVEGRQDEAGDRMDRTDARLAAIETKIDALTQLVSRASGGAAVGSVAFRVGGWLVGIIVTAGSVAIACLAYFWPRFH